ncbi:urokinase plasminogen activator surface receptor-like [Bufo bufo]|uniref:urokinase plasminogen activator surface receptor-like n=1 Tax=Bufo bufo TaxID=8384 RepID=UPI001ABEA88D|nr:urokinase plasminogen activator surface receptor-like [Bufo bufo]
MIQSIRKHRSTMVSAVAVLCLVAGLLEGAFSLTCYHCNSVEADCSTEPKQCDKATDVCMSTITELVTKGKGVKKMVVRSCGNKDLCNGNYSMSLNATNLYATIRCCEKDKCPTATLDVPKSTSENDVECSTCNEVGEKCKTPIKIKCTGQENKCATYGAKDAKTNVHYISQTCVTENVCAMQSVATLPFEQTLTTKFNCTNHAPSLLPGLLLPIAAVIAMLKLLS